MVWPWVVGGLILLVGVVFLVILRRGPDPGVEFQHAARLLPQVREHVEAEFFHAAATSGKPRGLRWKSLDWEPGAEFARDRQSGQLVALVGVTIQFEAVEGSDMEGLPAVGNLRNASAVFFYSRGRWHATGRAVFNMNPAEAIAFHKNQYERIEA